MLYNRYGGLNALSDGTSSCVDVVAVLVFFGSIYTISYKIARIVSDYSYQESYTGALIHDGVVTLVFFLKTLSFF